MWVDIKHMAADSVTANLAQALATIANTLPKTRADQMLLQVKCGPHPSHP